MRRIALIALTCSALLGASLFARSRHSGRTTPRDADTPQPPAAAPTDPEPLPSVLVDPALRIEKSARSLVFLSGGVAVKHYRIALGSEPIGNKEREGDGRTPEGTFYVCTRGTTPNHTHALGLSYPNEDDAVRALADGLISKREHRSIAEAIHRMQRPPWNTKLGGEIMIHEGGTDRDWTAGCISLAQEDMAELFDAVPLGAPVEILP